MPNHSTQNCVKPNHEIGDVDVKSLVNDKPLTKSMVGDRIWALKPVDSEAFAKELEAYFARGYPGFRVISHEYPFIFLCDERVPDSAK